MNRDILPERTWGAANSQVPSKFFCGEGPQLAWGEESAKRSERVCAVPQGESVLDASMMAELIVTKKEIGPQLKKSTGTSRARTKSPAAGSQRLPLAGRHGAEHWILRLCGSLVLGRFWRRGSLPQPGRRLKRGSGRTRQRGHRSFKAIRKISGTESASGTVPLASIWLAGNSHPDADCCRNIVANP